MWRPDRISSGARPAAIAVRGSFRQPLRQPAAVGDGQQLRAPADRERRQRPLARGRDQRELPLVGAGVGLFGVLGPGPVVRRIDVAAAGEQQPVGEREQLVDQPIEAGSGGRETTSGSPPASLTRAA